MRNSSGSLSLDVILKIKALVSQGNYTRLCTSLLGVILLLADYPWCNDTWFRCMSGVCINVTLTCDNVTDCPDGSDEDKEYAQCKYYKYPFLPWSIQIILKLCFAST